MRPAARTHIRAEPILPGDRVLNRAANLIATVASRPDGWLYMANWYVHRDMTLASGQSLSNILAGCAARGGTIRALFWHGTLAQVDPLLRSVVLPLGAAGQVLVPIIRQTLAGKITNIQKNEETARFINALPGGRCRAALDDVTRRFGSHHQKILVVGNNEKIVAIVGGVDWHNNRVRRLPGDAGSPLFDISVQIDGPAAVDIAELFERRWRADDRRARSIPLPPRRTPPFSPPAQGATVQIGPNFGCGAPFTRHRARIAGASSLIHNALRNCRQYFYAEDQYGVGNDQLADGIRRAFQNGARYGVVVLAGNAVVSDIPEIAYRRRRFWLQFPQVLSRQLLVFERLGDDGTALGPRAYVHSKLLIVDDEAMTIASVNQNRRSWTWDSELAALVTDNRPLVRGLRMDVWGSHLNLRQGDDIRDPMNALRIWQQAWNTPRSHPTLKGFDMMRPTPRMSAQIQSRVNTGTNWAAPILGVGGWVAGRLAGSGIASAVDGVMDRLFDEIYDPLGPDRC